jgi:hypothetical protein
MTERYENQILNLTPKSVTEVTLKDETFKVGDRWFHTMPAVGETIPEVKHEYQIQGIVDTGVEDINGPIVIIMLTDIPNDELQVWCWDGTMFYDAITDGTWTQE